MVRHYRFSEKKKLSSEMTRVSEPPTDVVSSSTDRLAVGTKINMFTHYANFVSLCLPAMCGEVHGSCGTDYLLNPNHNNWQKSTISTSYVTYLHTVTGMVHTVGFWPRKKRDPFNSTT